MGMSKVNYVFEATDKKIIPVIRDMIDLSSKSLSLKGVDLDEVEVFISSNLGKPDTKLWILYDGENINGFIFAYIVHPAIHPEVFIGWAYSDPHVVGGGKMLMSKVEEWARKKKINRISAMVRNNLKAFERSFGLELEYYGVGKEVIKGE